MKKKMLADFQICINVPLRIAERLNRLQKVLKLF